MVSRRDFDMDDRIREVTQAEPGSELRRRLIDEFHRDYERFYLHIAHLLARHFRLRPDQIDDIHGEVLMFAVEWANSWDESQLIVSQQAVFHHRARQRVYAYLQSGRHTGFSGHTTSVRRRNQLAKHRALLVELLQREPTNRELIDSFNEEREAELADARRQGMLASDLDLDPGVVSSVDEMSDGHRHPKSLVSSDVSWSVLGPDVCRRAAQQAAKEHERLGEAARIYWAEVLSSDFDLDLAYLRPVTAQALAEELGVSREQARRLIKRLQQIALSMCGPP